MNNVFFPEEMQDLPNWVLWRLEPAQKGSKLAKIPYSGVYHGKASSTNSQSWTTYKRVCSIREKFPDAYNGIGFVFSEDSGLIFIDIDHCMDDDGNPNRTASDILEIFHGNTFVELSQSGTGLHIITKGTIPKSFRNDKIGVESYNKARFCAMTGNALIRKEPELMQKEINVFYERYKLPDRKKKERKEPARKNIVSSSSGLPSDEITLSDAEIIKRASENPETGDLFRKLYNDGNFSMYESQSSGDFTLCMLIAEECNFDFSTIERLFTQSALCRDKWTQRPDYRERTINAAIDTAKLEGVADYIKRKRREKAKQYEEYFLHE